MELASLALVIPSEYHSASWRSIMCQAVLVNIFSISYILKCVFSYIFKQISVVMYYRNYLFHYYLLIYLFILTFAISREAPISLPMTYSSRFTLLKVPYVQTSSESPLYRQHCYNSACPIHAFHSPSWFNFCDLSIDSWSKL